MFCRLTSAWKEICLLLLHGLPGFVADCLSFFNTKNLHNSRLDWSFSNDYFLETKQIHIIFADFSNYGWQAPLRAINCSKGQKL